MISPSHVRAAMSFVPTYSAAQSAEIERTLARLACSFVDLADGDADGPPKLAPRCSLTRNDRTSHWPGSSASSSLPRASLAPTRNAQGIFSRRPAESVVQSARPRGRSNRTGTPPYARSKPSRPTGQPADCHQSDGRVQRADDGIRTRDPHLGNVKRIVRLSPPKPVTWCPVRRFVRLARPVRPFRIPVYHRTAH